MLILDLRIVKTEYLRSCCTDTPASCFCCSHFPLLLDRSFRRNFTTFRTIRIANIYLDDTFLNSCSKLNISNNSCCSRMSLLKWLYLCLAFYSYRSATAKKWALLVFNVLFLSICDSKEKSSPLKIGSWRMCQCWYFDLRQLRLLISESWYSH